MKTYTCRIPAFEVQVKAQNREDALAQAGEIYDDHADTDPEFGEIKIVERRDEFPIIDLCRDDLLQIGMTAQQIEAVPDDAMERIASKMGNAYCGGNFLDDLEEFAKRIVD